jgi:hypothetical protein
MPVSHTFPTTRWSLVLLTGDNSPRIRREALGELLKGYLMPLRHFLVQRMRLTSEGADDLLQSFVSDKVLEEQIIPLARRSRGRFRSFLLAALRQFGAAQFRHRSRRKRNGSSNFSLCSVSDPADPGAGPDEMFDAIWARGVIDLTLGRMRAECGSSDRADVWAVFDARVLLPTLEGKEPVPYEDLVAPLSLGSSEAAYHLLDTGKRMFARNLRAVVGQYAVDDSEVEREIADLRAALSRVGAAAGAARP